MMHEQQPSLERRDLERLSSSLARTFIQRWDLYAHQLDDGRYVCVRQPLTGGRLVDHLRGQITLGTYVLDQYSRVRFVVLDADEDDQMTQLVHAAKALEQKGVPSYLERSRRGGHLWLFLAQAVSGRDARGFGQELAAAYRLDGMELFPKQDQLRGGPGSLIRLPFGVHRLAGRRYGFVTADGQPLAPTLRQQIELLAAPETVPEAAFEGYRSIVPLKQRGPVSPPPEPASELLSERIKAAVSVQDFIGEYVILKPAASGAVGLCPFHDDHHPSFAVNAEENYWHCFAGCGGGSVIDFWMRWRGCDFTTALCELAEMLL